MSLFKRVAALFQNDKLEVSARFELLREAVFGTMSSFYLARDRKTGQVVGLKLLDPEKTAAFESRFKGLAKPSEGQIAMLLAHPRIVKTLEHGQTTDGRYYLLMEFIDGPGLNTLIHARDKILDGRRIELIRQMVEAVGAVHKAGFIHRDICPRNFICAPDASSLKLIDFGLTVPATKEFLQPGNRTGTPLYMAPEILRRRPTDHRVDIFSLGVAAYQLCTFELPWPTTDVSGKAATLHDTKPAISLLQARPDLNPALAAAIMKAIAVEPEERHESTDHFQRALRGLKGETA
jgi:serine/threonine protein kinase